MLLKLNETLSLIDERKKTITGFTEICSTQKSDIQKGALENEDLLAKFVAELEKLKGKLRTQEWKINSNVLQQKIIECLRELGMKKVVLTTKQSEELNKQWAAAVCNNDIEYYVSLENYVASGACKNIIAKYEEQFQEIRCKEEQVRVICIKEFEEEISTALDKLDFELKNIKSDLDIKIEVSEDDEIINKEFITEKVSLLELEEGLIASKKNSVIEGDDSRSQLEQAEEFIESPFTKRPLFIDETLTRKCIENHIQSIRKDQSKVREEDLYILNQLAHAVHDKYCCTLVNHFWDQLFLSTETLEERRKYKSMCIESLKSLLKARLILGENAKEADLGHYRACRRKIFSCLEEIATEEEYEEFKIKYPSDPTLQDPLGEWVNALKLKKIDRYIKIWENHNIQIMSEIYKILVMNNHEILNRYFLQDLFTSVIHSSPTKSRIFIKFFNKISANPRIVQGNFGYHEAIKKCSDLFNSYVEENQKTFKREVLRGVLSKQELLCQLAKGETLKNSESLKLQRIELNYDEDIPSAGPVIEEELITKLENKPVQEHEYLQVYNMLLEELFTTHSHWRETLIDPQYLKTSPSQLLANAVKNDSSILPAGLFNTQESPLQGGRFLGIYSAEQTTIRTLLMTYLGSKQLNSILSNPELVERTIEELLGSTHYLVSAAPESQWAQKYRLTQQELQGLLTLNEEAPNTKSQKRLNARQKEIESLRKQWLELSLEQPAYLPTQGMIRSALKCSNIPNLYAINHAPKYYFNTVKFDPTSDQNKAFNALGDCYRGFLRFKNDLYYLDETLQVKYLMTFDSLSIEVQDALKVYNPSLLYRELLQNLYKESGMEYQPCANVELSHYQLTSDRYCIGYNTIGTILSGEEFLLDYGIGFQIWLNEKNQSNKTVLITTKSILPQHCPLIYNVLNDQWTLEPGQDDKGAILIKDEEIQSSLYADVNCRERRGQPNLKISSSILEPNYDNNLANLAASYTNQLNGDIVKSYEKPVRHLEGKTTQLEQSINKKWSYESRFEKQNMKCPSSKNNCFFKNIEQKSPKGSQGTKKLKHHCEDLQLNPNSSNLT